MKKLLAIKLPSLLKGHPVRSQIDEIEKGADVNAKDTYNKTPLHCAVYNENLEITQLLIANGAEVNATDKDGDTPLHWAIFKGNLEITQLLEIVNHLDNNDSIENLTEDRIKVYYNQNKAQVDFLMQKRTTELVQSENQEYF